MIVEPLSVFLSRAQMAVTLTMHIIWPSINIGLALFLCIMEALWLKTKNPLYLQICKFWMKIFALAFGMGVVSGVVMSYELGTNFGQFTLAIGQVLGVLFVYEVLTAFFVEAGFLGIMLFGWERVSPRMHFFATLMVMLGTFVSAFWIMSANSWMQAPTGAHLVNGQFVVDSWMGAIFNPTFLHRFTHMVLASYLTCTFFIAGISAWYLLKEKHMEVAKTCFSFALWAALLFTPIQFFVGDAVGLLVHQYQPLKTAAIEGVWDTQQGAPLVLFGIPSEKQEKNLFPIQIPYGASLLNTHQLKGTLIGLKTVSSEDRPVVLPTFFGFRLMVGIAVLFLAVGILGLWFRYKKTLYAHPWFLKACVLMTPFGIFATLAGWFTAESGRQPWVVYGFLRTSQGASPILAKQVGISITVFSAVYLLAMGFFLYYFSQVIKKGPPPLDSKDEKEPLVIGYMHGVGE